MSRFGDQASWDPTARTVTFGTGVVRFTVPTWAEWVEGGRPTHCRSCGAPVLFVVATRSGKSSPIDPDGTSHFATCPDAPNWRRRRTGAGRRAVTGPVAEASAAPPVSHLTERS